MASAAMPMGQRRLRGNVVIASSSPVAAGSVRFTPAGVISSAQARTTATGPALALADDG